MKEKEQMLENLARTLGGQRRAHLACGVGLTVAGLLVIVFPTGARLRRSMASLATVRRAYTAKLSWAGRTSEMQQRLRQQQEILMTLEARLLSTKGLSPVTRSVAATARAVGCSVATIRPLPAHSIPRPAEEQPGPGSKDEPKGPEFIEWPIRLEVQGEYGQLEALLERLGELKTHLRVKELIIQPAEGDRELLSCELELAAYGLGEPKKTQTPNPAGRTSAGGRP